VQDFIEQIDVRVLLVGRTGLDAALRLDPGVELVRVRTALEAIGELSDPIDESSPTKAVVIIGPEADPGPAVNGDGDGRSEFLQAARLVDPGVRVLRALERGSPGRDPGAYGFDGLVNPDDPAPVISSVIRGGGSTNAPKATPVAPPPNPPPVASQAHAAPPPTRVKPPLSDESEPVIPASSVSNFGDAALVRLLLRGGEVTMPAISLLRARTADEGVQFFARDQAVPEGVLAVPLTCDGTAYGHLWSDRTLPEELRLHAEWLALWLRLGEQQAQLREAAFTDPLTGAWNRRYFDRYLGAAIQKARAARQPVTVMCFDIDDFKRFNDAFGHAAADEILIETVRLLRSVIRPSDRVCRVGGDEFAVIFHEPSGPRKAGSAPPASVFDIARRFQEQVCQQRFPKLGVEAPGKLTVSGGLATFPWDGTTPAELIRHADLLALESKRAGKNAIVFGPGRTSP